MVRELCRDRPLSAASSDAHGSRITIVTYHPTDGDDAFQPEAAKEQIDRMRLINLKLVNTNFRG